MKNFRRICSLSPVVLCLIAAQITPAISAPPALPGKEREQAPAGPARKHPLDGAPSMQIKMDYDPILTKVPIVYLKINGGEPRPFIFDTGYTGTILLDEKEAKKLDLKTTDSPATTTDVNGIKQSLRKAAVSIELLRTSNTYSPPSGSLTITVGKLPTMDETLNETPAAGLVGLSLFRDSTLYFNFERKELLIYPANPDVATVPGAVSAPLKIDPDGLRVQMEDLLGTKESLLVDTGAEGSDFSRALIDKLKPSLTYTDTSLGLNRSTATAKANVIDTLALKNIPVNNLVIDEAGSKGSILGMDILARFRVTIDIKRKEVVLEPTYTLLAQNKLSPGYSGLFVERLPSGNIAITHAITKYKNLIGSQLIGIDDKLIAGKTIKDLPVAQIQSVLDSYADTETTITIRADGSEKQITLKRMPLSEALPALKQRKDPPK